jgi:Uma2 family endonuclease
MITDINQLDKNGSYTYADYLTWQFTEMVELIKGKIYQMSPAPLRLHQQVVTHISGLFFLYFKNHQCKYYVAPFDVRLIKNKATDNEITTVVQPDFCVICDPTKLDDRGCIGSPDLIVEVLSNSTAKKDFNEKYNLYQENKVKEYWIINPDAKVLHHFFLNEEGIYIEKNIYSNSDVFNAYIFPELIIDLKEIF